MLYFMMEFRLQHDSPYNTTITQPDGMHLYRMQTPEFLLHGRDTTISKSVINAVGSQASWQPIGTIKRRYFGSDEVILYGRSITINFGTLLHR